MRQDQFEKLQQLEEKLADVFIGEAEPAKWPGHGIDPGAMDQKTRGDRYWVKKNAVATLSLMQRVAVTIGQVQLRGAGTTPEKPAEGGEQDHLDAEVQGYEKEAAKLLKDMQDGARKTVFDRKVHGRTAG
jgi:hypothetical protein